MFDCKTSFLILRKLRITKIMLKIAINLKNTGVYSDFPAFWGFRRKTLKPFWMEPDEAWQAGKMLLEQ